MLSILGQAERGLPARSNKYIDRSQRRMTGIEAFAEPLTTPGFAYGQGFLSPERKMMKIFGFGRAMQRERDNQRQAERNELAAVNFKLPTDGGYMLGLKYALFVLFGYYNARLFLHTVPGWEGYMTAFFALAGEATALYCLNTFTRTAGGHKTAVGLFGAALTIFSVTHATISFFRIDRHIVASGPVQFYCQRIAFPLLFGLLLLAAIIIPLTHWRKK